MQAAAPAGQRFSLVINVQVPLSSSLQLHANGSKGKAAREARVVAVERLSPSLTLPHSLTPSLSLSLSLSLSPSLSLSLSLSLPPPPHSLHHSLHLSLPLSHTSSSLQGHEPEPEPEPEPPQGDEPLLDPAHIDALAAAAAASGRPMATLAAPVALDEASSPSTVKAPARPWSHSRPPSELFPPALAATPALTALARRGA